MLLPAPVYTARRRLVAVAALGLVALPAEGQTPTPRLHREIPGDLGFDALPAAAVVAPQSARAVQQAAGAGRWDEAQRPGEDIVRPREAWSSPVREMDTETRSPVGYRLQYEEVFNPSVAPFKRTQAYDAVDDLGRLIVRSPALRPVPVGPQPPGAPTARFVGDLFVELSPRAPTPLPSVAAAQWVVSYRTVPAVTVAFAEDSAGNLVAQADVPQRQRVRLTYVLEAPETAFVAPRVAPVLLSDVARLTGQTPPPVPTSLRDSLDPVLRATGVRRTDSFDRALGRLVDYFRRFRDAPLTEQAGDNRYLTLALGGVGACRHRAYAFVLTLQGLGVPARYVGNEAHAWAEVALPGVGWSRVDLGGWDVPMQATAPSAREHFTPLHPDPLPRPDGYANSYSSYNGGRRDAHTPGAHGHDAGVAGDPGAAGAAQNGTVPTPGVGAPGMAQSGAPGAAGAGPGDAVGAGGATGATAEGPGAGAARGAPGAATGRPVVTTGAGTGAATGAATGAGDASEARAGRGDVEGAEEAPLRRPLLALLSVRGVGGESLSQFVRGRPVVCIGEARDEAGAPVGSLPVQVELLRNGRPWRVGRGGRADAVLGTTVTREDGRFEAQVLVPLELDAGEYALRLRSPGDVRHRPAVSE